MAKLSDEAAGEKLLEELRRELHATPRELNLLLEGGLDAALTALKLRTRGRNELWAEVEGRMQAWIKLKQREEE